MKNELPFTFFANPVGSNHESCLTDVNYNPQGLFFVNTLGDDPFLHSNLNEFVELGSNKTLAYFLSTMIYTKKDDKQSVYGETNVGTYVTFRGHLKFGPLRFNNLNIKLSVINSYCLNQSSTFSRNTGLEFSGNYHEIPRKLGVFDITSGIDLNLQLHITRNRNSSSTGSFQSMIKFLGIEKSVNVSISDTGLSFPVSGKIHGLFGASMICNAGLASWENQRFNAVGEFDDKSEEASMRDSLSKELNRYALDVFNKAMRRETSSKETEQRAKARLENVLLFKKTMLEKVRRIRKEYLKSERELKSAEKNLTYLEQAAKNYSNEVNELRLELDGLCEIKQCFNICQEGLVCTKCFHDIIAKIMGVCPATCFNSEQRRLAPYTALALCEREKCTRIHSTNGLFKRIFGKKLGNIFKSVLSFGISALATFLGAPPPVSSALGNGIVSLLDTGRVDEVLCSTVKGAITGFIGGRSAWAVYKQYAKEGVKKALEKSAVAVARKGASVLTGKRISCEREQRDGRWSCRLQTQQCTKAVFRYEYKHTPYSCKISCEKYAVTKTIEKSCCSTLPCAFFVTNLTCVAENALCKKARKDALEQISRTKASAVTILKSLNNARQNVLYWKMKKQKDHIKLMSASRSLNTSQNAVRSLGKAYNVTVEARKGLSRTLTKQLGIRALLGERLNSVVKIKLQNVRFNVTLSPRDETTLLPIYITFKLNGSREELSTVVDFARLNTSLRSIAREILGVSIGDLSSVSRKKRSVESTSTTDQKLSAPKNYHRLCSEFTNSERTLYQVVSSLYNLSSEIRGIRQNARNTDESISLNASDVLTRFGVNKTMASKLGIETNSDSYVNALENDPEILQVKDLRHEAIQDGREPLRVATDLLFNNWFATMEDVFSELSSEYECSGFDDCLRYTMDSLSEIYSATNLPGAQSIRDHIKNAVMKFSQLTQSLNMTVDDAAELSAKILHILEGMARVKVFCARSPNITKHPEAFTEIGVGKVLVLTCNATGDSLVYKWKVDGEIIGDQSTNVLLIKNTTVSHSGDYVCEVSNHIGKERSTQAKVIVHPPPSIAAQPVRHLSIVLSGDDSLHCLAESSNGNISYQWWFKPVNSTSFRPVMNETFSYLNFAPMKAHKEGWYFCNVSNSYGFNISTVSFVKALHFTLPMPAATLLFSVDHTAHQNTTFVNQLNTSFYNEIHSQISTLLSSFGNYSANTTERIRNLRPVNCHMEKSYDNKTQDVIELCHWKFQYAGENTTSNSSVNEEFEINARKVINATLGLKQAIVELVNATNDGSLSFSLNNQTYFAEKNSLTVQELSMLCSQGQTLVQDDFNCGKKTRMLNLEQVNVYSW